MWGQIQLRYTKTNTEIKTIWVLVADKLMWKNLRRQVKHNIWYLLYLCLSRYHRLHIRHSASRCPLSWPLTFFHQGNFTMYKRKKKMFDLNRNDSCLTPLTLSLKWASVLFLSSYLPAKSPSVRGRTGETAFKVKHSPVKMIMGKAEPLSNW